MSGHFTVMRGTADAMRLGYYKSAFISEREATMAGSATQANISTDPTTPAGFFRRLLHLVLQRLHREKPEQVRANTRGQDDRMKLP